MGLPCFGLLVPHVMIYLREPDGGPMAGGLIALEPGEP